MSSPANNSRISVTANRGTTGVLFGIAIITYVTRTYIRTRIMKQFFTEDVLLSFAVVCLCVITAIAYADMQGKYDVLGAILGNAGYNQLLKVIETIPRTLKLENAAGTLWWCVIFPVKLAFLFFFRRLIVRWRSLYLWWWWATAFTGVALAVSVAAAWLTCPYDNLDGIRSCSGPSSNRRVIRDTAITTVMDVTTDFIVLSFPIIILWQVQINTLQKAGMGLWLCLSLVMVIIAIVRMGGIKLGDGVDIVWLAFWQQQESSIAVIMVSMSAFRSLFVESARAPASRRHLKYSANHWRKRLIVGPLDPKKIPLTWREDWNYSNSLERSLLACRKPFGKSEVCLTGALVEDLETQMWTVHIHHIQLDYL